MPNATIRAAKFTSSIGVEAQINYTDGAYHNASNVLADLQYIGVNLVRSASLNSAGSAGGQNNYNILASSGIHFDLVVNGNRPISATIGDIDTFEKLHPGAVYAIEGPNEVDHNPITYNGLTGSAAAVAYQNDLYTAVHADPTLATKSVYSFSLGSGATPTGGYDYVAEHPYPAHGSEPLASLLGNLAYAPAGATSVLTETGYSTAPNNVNGVDQLTQAKLTLNMIFDAFENGVDTVYLYGLLDAYPDTTGSNLGNHYGLFDINNTPKVLATALHNLMEIEEDNGEAAKSFTTSTLDYSVSNAPSSSSSLVLEKSNGAYDIVLWNEPQIWNYQTHNEISATPLVETVKLAGFAGSVKIYDPLVGSSLLSESDNVSSINVVVTDHPVILEVSGYVPTSSVASLSPLVDGTNLSFDNSSVGTSINLSTGQAAGNGEKFSFSNIENITGSHYADNISGDGNANIINGGSGDDTINAGPGADTVTGGPGADTINGNGGKDVLYGNGGNDIIAGGAGADTLTGGSGNDTFVYNLVTDSPIGAGDLITDFKHGSDKIDLTGLHLLLTNDITINSSGGMTYLYIDANNDGTVDMQINFTGANALTAGDIVTGIAATAATPVHHDLATSLHAVAVDHGIFG